jgi:hypothetical protein
MLSAEVDTKRAASYVPSKCFAPGKCVHRSLHPHQYLSPSPTCSEPCHLHRWGSLRIFFVCSQVPSDSLELNLRPQPGLAYHNEPSLSPHPCFRSWCFFFFYFWACGAGDPAVCSNEVSSSKTKSYGIQRGQFAFYSSSKVACLPLYIWVCSLSMIRVNLGLVRIPQGLDPHDDTIYMTMMHLLKIVCFLSRNKMCILKQLFGIHQSRIQL